MRVDYTSAVTNQWIIRHVNIINVFFFNGDLIEVVYMHKHLRSNLKKTKRYLLKWSFVNFKADTLLFLRKKKHL